MAMATLLLLLLASSLALEFSLAQDAESVHHDQRLARVDLAKDLEDARTRFSALEQSLLEKDLILSDKEKTIAFLKDKLQAIEEHGSKEVEAMLDRTKIKVEQLERKVTELEDALKEKGRELLNFKERVQMLEAAEETKMLEQEQLQKLSLDQRKHLDKVQQALQGVRDSVTQAQAEIGAKEQELLKINRQWLPSWAAKHASRLQLSEKTWATQKRFMDHFETIKKNFEQSWSPLLKQHLGKARISVTPYVKALKGKTIEGLEATKGLLRKGMEKVKGVLQVTEKLGEPYIDKAVAVIQPYFNQAKEIFKPYTKKITRHYNKSLKYATEYHIRLQRQVRRALKKNKYLTTIARKELVWFLASALLIMPLYGILMLFSLLLGDKKRSKRTRGTGSHGHRKVRRSKQVDK